MFIHAVLFIVKPKEITKYRKDSLMWARHTKKAPGFLAYRTMKRYGFKDQYVSVYQWNKKSDHDRFMCKYHDWLVDKSKAKVRVLDYYNFKQLDSVK
jgi:heme-degrading monooxygenase HmoA